jgi:hypothetical protein
MAKHKGAEHREKAAEDHEHAARHHRVENLVFSKPFRLDEDSKSWLDFVRRQIFRVRLALNLGWRMRG